MNTGVAKINQYQWQWKELIKITTSTIFDGKMLKIREYTAPWNWEILQTFVCWGYELAPQQTFLCKKNGDFAW